jgi:hypothetical protein
MIQLDDPSPIVQKELFLISITLAKNIGKTLNLITLHLNLKATVHTLNLDVKKFSTVTKSNIQMKIPCHSEVGFMNTNLENNPTKKKKKP